MILFGVGAVILLFAVMNYINLTVAQTGVPRQEMCRSCWAPCAAKSSSN